MTAMLSRKISRCRTTESGERPKSAIARAEAQRGRKSRRASTYRKTALAALTSSIAQRMVATVMLSGEKSEGIQVRNAIWIQPSGGWSYQYV